MFDKDYCSDSNSNRINKYIYMSLEAWDSFTISFSLKHTYNRPRNMFRYTNTDFFPQNNFVKINHTFCIRFTFIKDFLFLYEIIL